MPVNFGSNGPGALSLGHLKVKIMRSQRYYMRSKCLGKVPRYWRKARRLAQEPDDYAADLSREYYLRPVPRVLDRLVPYGGLRVGRYLYVAGDPARAFAAGTFYVDKYREMLYAKRITLKIYGGKS